MKESAKRWSGLDWADQKKEIMVVGVGSIGSFTSFSLSRIGHDLVLIDGDNVDETNVQGGQMYRVVDVGVSKVSCIRDVCRTFGTTNDIEWVNEMYRGLNETGMLDICICGLDNMAARKLVFESWVKSIKIKNTASEALFIDGRCTGEMYEIFAIQGNDEIAIQEYMDNHLFTDDESEELDCTKKSTTFVAMGIASQITATVCNFLTNYKLKMEIRDIPFYQRMFIPNMLYTTRQTESNGNNNNVTTISTISREEIKEATI